MIKASKVIQCPQKENQVDFYPPDIITFSLIRQNESAMITTIVWLWSHIYDCDCEKKYMWLIMVHLCSYKDYLNTKIRGIHDSQEKFPINRKLLHALMNQDQEDLAHLG